MQRDDYWKRRQIREAFNVFTKAEKEADEIARLYAKSSVYLDSGMQRIFDKFKEKYGLTDAEAKRVLEQSKDRGSIDAALQALENVPQTDSVLQLRQVIESAAFAARIARIRQLETNVDKLMNNVYKQELIKHTNFYDDLAKESYLKSIFHIQKRAGAAFPFTDINPRFVDRLLHSKWSGKNYSQRIWTNTHKLAQDVKEQIILGALTGKTEREMSTEISQRFASGAMESRRLIRTESNYIATQSDMAARKECGIEKYMYLATLDLKTCQDTCAKLDGRIFLVRYAEAGYNCPPMHPWCRCTTISIISDEWIKKQKRRARDPVTGKTYTVPLSMTYQEWYKQYVLKKPEALEAAKEERKKAADRKQFHRYKDLLGIDAPRTLDGFQAIKYNDEKAWKDLQLKYKDQKLLNNIRKNYNLKIHEGKQGKHILGHNNYGGKSYLLPQTDPQELVNKYAGTGIIKRDKAGKWIHRQFFMNDKQIGIVVDKNTGEEIPTRYFSIEFSKKNGTHVVPRKEQDSNGNS